MAVEPPSNGGRTPVDQRLSPPELQRRAVSGSLWTAVHSLLSVPIAFIANAVIARVLGVTDYGHLAFLTTALALAVPLANLGFNAALIQAGSRAEAAGHRDATDDLLRKSLGFHALVEFPILVCVALALTRGDPLWEVVAVGAGILAPSLLSGAALAVTIENRTAAAARLAILVNVATHGATVATALLTQSPSAVWAARTVVTGALSAAVLLLIDRRRRRATLQPRLPLILGPAFWRFALLTWASGMVGLLVFSRSEIFLLQAFDQKEALGLFALAFGLSQQITAPADAMLHPLLPAVAGVLSAWPDRALRAFERATRVSALVCGAIAASVLPALVLAVPFIYGDEFSLAGWLFVPLALTSIFQSVNNPVIAFTNARQRGGLLLRAYVVALIVDVVIAVALIPAIGAWGAVIASVCGQVVAIAWLARAEPLATAEGHWRLLRLHAPFIVGAVIGGAALLLATAVQAISPVVLPMLICVAAASTYVAAIRHFGFGMTVQDHDALLEAMAAPLRRHVSRLLRPLVTTA